MFRYDSSPFTDQLLKITLTWKVISSLVLKTAHSQRKLILLLEDRTGLLLKMQCMLSY